MRYSLISRDWIADCAEIMHQAYFAVSYNNINNERVQNFIVVLNLFKHHFCCMIVAILIPLQISKT